RGAAAALRRARLLHGLPRLRGLDQGLRLGALGAGAGPTLEAAAGPRGRAGGRAMSLRGRLGKLANDARKRGLLPPPGCPACRGRGGMVALVLGRGSAGPPPCAACGVVPERVITIVERASPARGECPADDAGPPG